MEGNSDLDPLNFNIGLNYKGFSTRFIVDRYHGTTRDLYDESYGQALQNDFDSYLVEARYDLKIGSKLSLLPRFNYRRQSPYRCISEACREAEFYFGKTAERVEESLMLSL